MTPGRLSPPGVGDYFSSAQSGGSRQRRAPGRISMRKVLPLSGSPSRLKVISWAAVISNHDDTPSTRLGELSGLASVLNSAGSSSWPVKMRRCSSPSLINACGHSC